MMSNPTPEQILEELADKTAEQIDRLAPIAFDNALSEMTRYHRFLLLLNASQSPDGSPFNYAEIAGDDWTAPHREWVRQYARLFERAADKIPDEPRFIRSLANAPIRLLPSPDEARLSMPVVTSLLDLWPIMMHRIEAWVTKRTTIETREGSPATPRLALAGSDAKAYANVLPDLIGAMESLLQIAPSLYRWQDQTATEDEQRWAELCASWPFLWQHLTNSAYCLAVTVWNEDEAGAALFRDALLRWPNTLFHDRDDYMELREPRMLSPDLLSVKWDEVCQSIQDHLYEGAILPSPRELFTIIVRGAHDDVVLLTASLLLFWTINGKQLSDIGGRMSRALLQRELVDDDEDRPPQRNLTLVSVFFDVLRTDIVGERFRDATYGAQLDHLITVLDNMTERRVVPGRVYTPSTVNGRYDLLVALGSILVASAPNSGNEAILARIAEWAEHEQLLPDKDGALRRTLQLIERLKGVLELPMPSLISGVAILAPGRDAGQLAARLQETIGLIEAIIRDKRLARLQAKSISAAKLESVRAAVEKALLNTSPATPIFQNVSIEHAGNDLSAERSTLAFNDIDKAQLVEPPMDWATSNFEETFVSATMNFAGSRAWAEFTRRPRRQSELLVRLKEPEFWRTIAPLVQQVGPNPVLVVSRSAEGRELTQLLRFTRKNEAQQLRIEYRPRDGRGGSYIATVEGVEVFGADFDPGVAWLFSSRALQRIRYAELDEPGRYVEIDFELAGTMKGTLRLHFRQHFDWAETPVFDLRASAAETKEE